MIPFIASVAEKKLRRRMAGPTFLAANVVVFGFRSGFDYHLGV